MQIFLNRKMADRQLLTGSGLLSLFLFPVKPSVFPGIVNDTHYHRNDSRKENHGNDNDKNEWLEIQYPISRFTDTPLTCRLLLLYNGETHFTERDTRFWTRRYG